MISFLPLFQKPNIYVQIWIILCSVLKLKILDPKILIVIEDILYIDLFDTWSPEIVEFISQCVKVAHKI